MIDIYRLIKTCYWHSGFFVAVDIRIILSSDQWLGPAAVNGIIAFGLFEVRTQEYMP